MSNAHLRRSQAIPLGQLMPSLIQPITGMRGFRQAQILLDWPNIVSEKFAAFCKPEKMMFPHGNQGGGTLYVRALSGMVAELTFLEPLILERINQYFGYKAVKKLVVLHTPSFELAPTLPPKKATALPEEQQQELQEQLASVTDDALHEALYKLGLALQSQ